MLARCLRLMIKVMDSSDQGKQPHPDYVNLLMSIGKNVFTEGVVTNVKQDLLIE